MGVKISLTLREEHRLRVFEKGMLRIFGPKRDEVTGGWRRLHKGFFYFDFSPSKIRMITSRSMR
jgi:hypothetical protein